jgi:pilus assembly protein CpaC
MTMHTQKTIKTLSAQAITLILALSIGAAALAVMIPTVGAQEAYHTQQLELISGKSIVLTGNKAVKRVSVGNPDVADFILLSPKEIYITGKAAGSTNMTLWQNGRVVAVYDISVRYDVAMLKQDIFELMPEENQLNIMATNDTITLSGRVSKAAHLTQAISLAQAYAPEDKVNNLVQVGGVHQVMIEVRVAEMAKSTARSFGIDWAWQRGDEFVYSRLADLTDIVGQRAKIDSGSTSTGGFDFSTAANLLFRFTDGNDTWTGVIDALKDDGLVKILAEPTLIALSGQQASFLAGGEFPVPVPQGLGTVAVEYKPFGVGLTFTPTVLSEDHIGIEVSPEVSELDFTSAVNFQGFLVPGLNTRRASTMVELGDGQSFAIAGLLKSVIRDRVNKYPFLGDIPVLGALFRSKEFQKNETELVIVITPRLVKPMESPENIPLPTDYYLEPSEAEYYLLSQLEGQPPKPVEVNAGFDGDFGHSVPK